MLEISIYIYKFVLQRQIILKLQIIAISAFSMVFVTNVS